MANQIIKGIGKGFQELGQETAEKLVEETGKIIEPIITAQELLGGIKPLSNEELAQKKAEDEEKRKKEIAEMRSQISGRSIEEEMETIRHQQEKENEEKEKYAARVKEQQERQNQMVNMEVMEPPKHPKNKGGNPHKKKQEPDQTQMSQTAEFKGKID